MYCTIIAGGQMDDNMESSKTDQGIGAPKNSKISRVP
jgi:hypothetical protein